MHACWTCQLTLHLECVARDATEEDQGILVTKAAHRLRGQVDALHGVVAVPGQGPVVPAPTSCDEHRLGDVFHPLVGIAPVSRAEKAMSSAGQLQLRPGSALQAARLNSHQLVVAGVDVGESRVAVERADRRRRQRLKFLDGLSRHDALPKRRVGVEYLVR